MAGGTDGTRLIFRREKFFQTVGLSRPSCIGTVDNRAAKIPPVMNHGNKNTKEKLQAVGQPTEQPRPANDAN